MKQILCILLITSFCAAAQSAPQSSTAPAPSSSAAPQAPAAAAAAQPPTARPQDVDTIDHILAALYDVISGPAGQERDWNRMRSLFIAEGRLVPNSVRPDGTISHRVLSPDDYVERARGAFAKEGFFESEASRQLARFGNIAHAFSTYESRHEKGGQPFVRGINSIQMLNDGKRWYIVTIMWQGEDKNTPIPAEYLKH